MDYELAWNEMKNWLDTNISDMLERKKIVSGRAYHIIKSKIDGLKIAHKYMEDYEKGRKRMVKLGNPYMLKIKDNNGNTAIVKIKEFHSAMVKYCHDFGYPTVTEDEIRTNVHKICMLGEDENLDVIGHLVKSHIHEDEYGKYRMTSK